MNQVSSHDLVLTPAAVLRATLAISLVLILLHLVGLYFRLVLDHDFVYGFVPLFDLEGEKNAPTLYSSILLVSAGSLCILAGFSNSKWRWHWALIAVGFFAAGIDETFGLHEPLFFVLRGNQSEGTAHLVESLHGLQWGDLLPWMFVIAVLLAVWYVSFVRHVGIRLTAIAIASASVYFLGALGIDSLTSVEMIDNFDSKSLIVFGTLEEVFELVGACLFIYTIMKYLAEKNYIVINLRP